MRTGKIAAGAAALALLGIGAQAADLPVKAPPAPYVQPFEPFSWTGLYTGIHAGYGWARRTNPDIQDLLGTTVLTEPSGFFVGSAIGYNWQINRLVLGVEADFSHGWVEGKVTFIGDADAGIGGSANIDWFGSVRGRLGLAYDRFLVYATGGFAWAHVHSTLDFNLGPDFRLRLHDEQVHTGWTLGGGVEVAVGQGWSVKAEYLYADLGTRNYAHLSPEIPIEIGMTMHTVKVGLNREFGELPHQALMRGFPADAAPFSWTGLYAGGHVGYGWGRRTLDVDGMGGGDLPSLPAPQGAFWGTTVGFNWQSGRLVLGAEADFSFGHLRDSVTFFSGGPFAFGATAHMDYFGTVRGRVGLARDRLLVYGTGGLAWGQVHSTIDLTFGPAELNIYDVKTHVGWSAGGGFEYAFAPNWSVKAEYLYLDLGTKDYEPLGPELPIPIGMTAHTAKLGLNYKLDLSGLFRN